MEHLSQWDGQTTSIFPAIPYLCKDKYDEGPFLDYPHRSGLPRLEIDGTFCLPFPLPFATQNFLKGLRSDQLEPFLQNWLFFGLLKEVLGDLYRHEDFITTCLDGENEKAIVTTAILLSRLKEWEASITQDTVALRTVYEHIAKCLNLTYACLIIKHPTFDNDLKFQLASVAELLGYAVSKACNVAWTDDPHLTRLPITWGGTINENFRRSVLLKRSNCCPSQMQMLTEHFREPQALAFVANCFHDDGFQSHHAACDENNCHAGDVVASGQVTRHVSDSCACKFLHVDENLLADCLKKGTLPLIRLKEDANSDQISIDIVASTDSTSYVALSHVWADGLGNPTATALPRCQLSRLKTLIDSMDIKFLDDSYVPEDATEMLLWCDTLCCPVKSEESQKMALRQMYRTYEEASLVLVLDRSLISHRVGGMEFDEKCVRIATSRWMTRLWTLQEGALPAKKDKLWFQFTETALPFRALYVRLTEIERTDIRRRGVASSVIGRFLTFRTLFDVESSDNRGAELNHIMRGLFYRSVTVPSDEPLIIATLLALDLSPILASEPAQRMNVLWRIIGKSPSGIDKQILFHLGLKTRERGLRWAPQSLLSVDRHFSIPKPGEEEHRGFLGTERNARGLLVELAGFRISIAKPAKGLPHHLAGFDSLTEDATDRNCLLLKNSNGLWYVLKHRLFGESDCPHGLEEMCAVICRLYSPWVLYRGSSSLIPNDTKAHRGLLVEKANEQQPQSNESTFVEIKSQVSFCHVATEMNEVCQAAYSLAQELASSAAARRLEDLAITTTDLADPVYKEALQSVDLEFKRLSKSPVAMEAVTASTNSSNEQGIIRLAEYMQRFYRGLYLHIEEYAPANRKWCVD
ncbi:hypothetical protein BDR22DRAFT_895340 [Usnea florida]